MNDKPTERPSAWEARWDWLRTVLEGVTWRFWTCYRGCQGCVSWEGDVATCEECGAKSTDEEGENDATL